MTIWDRFANRVRDAVDQGGGRPPSTRDPGAAPAGLGEKLGLTRISDEALATELERRRRVRGKVAHRRPAADDELEAMREARRTRLREWSLTKAYASLELPTGSTRPEVERAYRALLRQYHPDRHLGDPEAHRSAVALLTSLTDSYLALLQQFERRY